MTGGHWQFSTSLRLRSKHQSAEAIRTAPVTVAEGDTNTLGYGTGDNTVDCIVAAKKTVAAGATATWDLYTGTDFLDMNDRAATLRAVRSIVVRIASGGDSSGVRIGGAGSNPWPAAFADPSDMALIYPDGPPWAAGNPAGIAVSASALNLKVENLGAVAVNLRVYIAGTLAGAAGTVFGLPGMTYP